jgi:MFS family permease
MSSFARTTDMAAVGGEYPMTSTSAMEGGGGPGSSTADKLHRGRNVQLAFLMQGWGQLFNQAVLIILLLAFHSQGGPPYKETSTQWTYRVSFAVILPFTLYLAYYRFYKVRYADDALRRAKRRSNTFGYDAASLKLVMRHYWPRLLATAGCWVSFFAAGHLMRGSS